MAECPNKDCATNMNPVQDKDGKRTFYDGKLCTVCGYVKPKK